MQKRVGFTLDRAQIEQACERFIAPRLLPDETARAQVVSIGTSTDDIRCVINVEKKRVRRKRNGAQA